MSHVNGVLIILSLHILMFVLTSFVDEKLLFQDTHVCADIIDLPVTKRIFSMNYKRLFVSIKSDKLRISFPL